MQIKYDIRLKSVNQTASSFNPYLLSRENNVPILQMTEIFGSKPDEIMDFFS